MKKLVVGAWCLVLGVFAANAAEITINVDEGQTLAYAIDGGELISTGEEGPAKVTFAANRNATYAFYGVAADGTPALIKSVVVADAGETVSETGNAQVAVDTRATKEIDGSAGAVKVDLTYSGDGWGESVGGSATITLAIGEGEAKPYRTELTGSGTVSWTPPFDGTYVFTHTVGSATETARFAAVKFRGGQDNPWEIGADDAESVTAYVKDGYLYLEGEGEVTEFGGDGAPWAGYGETLEGIGPLSRAITIPASVLATLPITVTGGGEPSGAVSGAEFEQVRIVGGKVLLGVSVCTNGDLSAETESWGAAKLDPATVEQAEDGKGLVIPVPATAEKGFMILKSKGAEK